MTSYAQARYVLDDGTDVVFDIDPGPDFRPVRTGETSGRVAAAVEPLVAGAREVLDRLKAVGPDEVELRFGIRVSGTANWCVARAASEASFEVTLRWCPRETSPADGAGPDLP